MKNELWEMFELTGNIDTYLYYKSVTEENKMKNSEMSQDEQSSNPTLT